ncbi:MAG TPA: PSD1 and planctomycete cytochrome C domain-containing protein [Gemmataceae bacterium]|nr:PSD1 and planctomycete cytochrome C domain-containing protein [Gemmataceae bacterium]
MPDWIERRAKQFSFLIEAFSVVSLGWFACCLHADSSDSTKIDPDHAAKMTQGRELFSKQVRQILIDQCMKCHGGEKTRSGLDLVTREGLIKGGDNGPSIVVGKAKESRLYKLIAHLEEPHMPAKLPKLGDKQIADIAQWIDLGASYDKPLSAKAEAGTKKPMIVTNEDRKFWAFQPLQRVVPPKVSDQTWCRTPVDQFILAKLEEKHLSPNPSVDRRRLIRRVYFDLIGLPPAPEEIEEFVGDKANNAYEKLIDRLLDNPHFGERWARHWLDIARFAESHGYEQDYDRPFAYHYRDFVIKAFNQDLPYDTFVKWQIAGDEFEPENPLALMATGFLGAGVHSTQITKNQVEKERYDELDDMTRTVGTAMLGLTVGCARCHDHKYDPIPTRDYYRMLSTFTTTVRSDYDINMDPKGFQTAKAIFDSEHVKLVDQLARYEKENLPKHFDEWLAGRSKSLNKLTKLERIFYLGFYLTQDSEWLKLNKAVRENEKTAPKPVLVKALICSEGVPAIRNHTQGGDFLEQTHFLNRGDPNQKIAVAPQGFLQVLMRHPDQEKHWLQAPPQNAHTSYRRKALANWMTDLDAGAGHLLARVIVNRLWQHHMGRGLVATPSDFGYQGDKPTHPELLDWLAQQLIDNGWRLKPIHKLILQSAVYQESAAVDHEKAKVDPDNRLCWRHSRQRLEAEIIRDSLLAVSGSLDSTMFGPGTLDLGMKRRSIYFFVKRSQLISPMMLFDASDTLQGLELRSSTVIAPQALMLINSAIVRSFAGSFAKRIEPKEAEKWNEVVSSGYVKALGRQPNDEELKSSMEFLHQQTESYKADGKNNALHLAVADFCQVLMGLNEFVYVD